MDAERGLALLCSWCWDTRGWPQRPSSQQCLQHTVLKSYRPTPTQADCPTFKQTSPKMSRYTDASVGGLKQEDLTLPGCSCAMLALSTSVQVPCACAQRLGASPSSRGQTDGRTRSGFQQWWAGSGVEEHLGQRGMLLGLSRQHPGHVPTCCWLLSTPFPALSQLTCHGDSAHQPEGDAKRRRERAETSGQSRERLYPGEKEKNVQRRLNN